MKQREGIADGEYTDYGMNMKRYCVLTITLTLLLSCAPVLRAGIDMTASGGIVWPGKPEKPRIQYLWSLQSVGPEGAAAKRRLSDLLTGTAEDITDPQTSPILLRPQGIYVDEKRFYIADPGAVRVTVIDRETMDVLQILYAKGQSLLYPLSVVSDSGGRIYVSDPELKKVVAYSDQGKFLSFFEGDMQRPTGLAIDHGRGTIYVVDTLGHTVYIYGLDGKRKGRIGKRGEADGEFNYPSHVSVDEKGTVYVTDFLNFRVQIFSPEGQFVKKFGLYGDSFDALDKPKGIAVDSEGNIYVVDAGQDTVKIFNQEGQILLFFGKTGHGYGQFYLPSEIFIGRDNTIYVADTINMRIQAFKFLTESSGGAK